MTLLWVAAATVTANILRHEMNEVFDSALEETAQRILPLAVQDIVGRDEQKLTQRIATLRQHDEYFTYVVRNAEGQVLLGAGRVAHLQVRIDPGQVEHRHRQRER